MAGSSFSHLLRVSPIHTDLHHKLWPFFSSKYRVFASGSRPSLLLYPASAHLIDVFITLDNINNAYTSNMAAHPGFRLSMTSLQPLYINTEVVFAIMIILYCTLCQLFGPHQILSTF